MPLAALILTGPGPGTYTGEDSAELLLPGSAAVVELVEARLHELGARRAEPGEFTARAYHHGRLTLEQAEGVAAVIAAVTTAELDGARELLEGRTGAVCRAWADRLADLLALVEVGIDFTDQEDVVPITAQRLADTLGTLAREMGAVLGAHAGGERRSSRPKVVLGGVPSSGKSALFNRLVGRERSVVHAQPGTTRDVIQEPIELTGSMGRRIGVTLVDVAGLDDHGAAADRAARAALAAADLVLWCTAADADPRDDEAEVAALPSGTPVIHVLTKADLSQYVHGTIDAVPGAIAVCSLDGWNVGSLRAAIFDHLWAGSAAARGSGGAGLAWPRHRAAVAGARDLLDSALAIVALQDGQLADAEVLAEVLRDALGRLGEVTGRVESDDVLGRVFGAFCIGK